MTITATAAPPNNPPAFSDGSSTTRSVSASAPAVTRVGQPVTATYADSGDTLTYSLEGTDAASFDINTSNGQILARSGVTLTVGTTYQVTVAASDGTASTSITVTISVVLNNRPTFSSTTATRSVPENTLGGDRHRHPGLGNRRQCRRHANLHPLRRRRRLVQHRIRHRTVADQRRPRLRDGFPVLRHDHRLRRRAHRQH